MRWYSCGCRDNFCLSEVCYTSYPSPRWKLEEEEELGQTPSGAAAWRQGTLCSSLITHLHGLWPGCIVPPSFPGRELLKACVISRLCQAGGQWHDSRSCHRRLVMWALDSGFPPFCVWLRLEVPLQCRPRSILWVQKPLSTSVLRRWLWGVPFWSASRSYGSVETTQSLSSRTAGSTP